MEKELKDIDAMLNNVGAMGDDVVQMASGLKDLWKHSLQIYLNFNNK